VAWNAHQRNEFTSKLFAPHLIALHVIELFDSHILLVPQALVHNTCAAYTDLLLNLQLAEFDHILRCNYGCSSMSTACASKFNQLLNRRIAHRLVKSNSHQIDLVQLAHRDQVCILLQRL
jgi:hypothetical protein